MDRQTHRLSTKVLDMIIAHLIYDTTSLKAYAATCFAWYNVATPYLHHTLIVREYHPKVARRGLDPLPVLDELGLLPFVKKVQSRATSSTKRGSNLKSSIPTAYATSPLLWAYRTSRSMIWTFKFQEGGRKVLWPPFAHATVSRFESSERSSSATPGLSQALPKVGRHQDHNL